MAQKYPTVGRIAEYVGYSLDFHDRSDTGDVEMNRNNDLDIELLVMGKTGHGKSSTGNSILGRKEFAARGGGMSVTSKPQVGFTEFKGRTIKVVDIPGVTDTAFPSKQEQEKMVTDSVKSIITQFPNGFDALLLVLSYTARMTKEEKEAIQSLKHIFGGDVLEKHTICVFTHGDSFEDDQESKESKQDFETWCKETSSYNDLLQECGSRYVLFDNITSILDKKEAQLINLVSKIDSLSEKNTKYTVDKFNEARELILSLHNCSKENGMIKDDFRKIRDSLVEQKHETAHHREQLERLEDRILRLKNLICENKTMPSSIVKDLDSQARDVSLFKKLIDEKKPPSFQKVEDEVEKLESKIVRRVASVEKKIDEVKQRSYQDILQKILKIVVIGLKLLPFFLIFL